MSAARVVFRSRHLASVFSFLSAALAVGAVAALTLALPAPVSAGGLVNSCDPAALNQALAGGGLVTFNCDGTITLTNTLVITNNTTLDSSARTVTLSSSGGVTGVRLLTVSPGVSLILTRLRLVNGLSTNGTAGAVFLDSNAVLSATSCVFSNNLARGTNGVDGRDSGSDAEDPNGSDGHSGAIAGGAAGGAIYNLGRASFFSCSFFTNSVVGGDGGNGGNGGPGGFTGGDGGNGNRGGPAIGGAIFNAGTLFITNCTFHENRAVGGAAGLGGAAGEAPFPGFTGKGSSGGPAAGAAIFDQKSTLSEITSCTFSLNGAASGDSGAAATAQGTAKTGPGGSHSSGGAIASYGTNHLLNCTFFANTTIGGNGGDGGASVFSGGKGGAGGGSWGGNLFNGSKVARLFATNCTFSDGSAIGGAGGQAGEAPFPKKNGSKGASRGGNLSNSNGVAFLKNCIVAYASVGTNGYGKFTDAGFNISSDKSVKLNHKLGSLLNVDPKLDILRANGGFVQTSALFFGSPAIDAGDTNFCVAIDARGIGRPFGRWCDMGAFESGAFDLVTIVTQPTNVVVASNGTAAFSVTVNGSAPFSYRWTHNGTNVFTETNLTRVTSTLTLTNVRPVSAGAYQAIISNPVGSITSIVASLIIQTSAPVVLTQPSFGGVPVIAGSSPTLSVVVGGSSPFFYQWLRDGTNFVGATNSTLAFTNVQAADAGTYQVRITNLVGSVLSANAVLTIEFITPTVIQQPADALAAPGEDVTFAPTFGGSGLAFQWFFNNTTLLSGATNASLVLTNVQAGQAGTYLIVATNIQGGVTSAPATLIVTNSAPLFRTQPVTAASDVSPTTNITFSVSILGAKPLFYQWFFNDVPLSVPMTNNFIVTNLTSGSLFRVTNSFASSSVTISGITTNEEGVLHVIVTNLLGSALSDDALMDVRGFGL